MDVIANGIVPKQFSLADLNSGEYWNYDSNDLVRFPPYYHAIPVVATPVATVPVAVPVPMVIARTVVPYDTPTDVGGLVPTNAINETHIPDVFCRAQFWANAEEAEGFYELATC